MTRISKYDSRYKTIPIADKTGVVRRRRVHKKHLDRYVEAPTARGEKRAFIRLEGDEYTRRRILANVFKDAPQGRRLRRYRLVFSVNYPTDDSAKIDAQAEEEAGWQSTPTSDIDFDAEITVTIPEDDLEALQDHLTDWAAGTALGGLVANGGWALKEDRPALGSAGVGNTRFILRGTESPAIGSQVKAEIETWIQGRGVEPMTDERIELIKTASPDPTSPTGYRDARGRFSPKPSLVEGF